MDALAVPFAAGEALELFAQEEDANQVLRGRRHQQPREGRDLLALHAFGIAAVR